MLFRRITSICVFSLTLAFSLFAQGDRGTITGTVTDSAGAPMPNVVVNITNTATNTLVRVTTTGTGEYNVASLQPGSYRVEIVAPGFKRYVQAGIEAAAGTSVRLDAKLEIGQVTESVEVRAQSVQLQTENAKVTSSVENKLIDELPLVVGGAMRSPFDLVTMIPQARGSGNSLMIGGGQAAAWGATLDGLSVNTNRAGDAAETAYLTPSVEAITEFAVETNGFKAEYAQAGGGMITFASKSGTNAFHGTAYDFVRNDHFDARGFFATQRSVYKQNDFGGSVGGPVWIPKLYNGRDHTFFFVSYEGFRNRIGSNGGTLSVPTPEMYQGDFSKWVDAKGALLQIYDPQHHRGQCLRRRLHPHAVRRQHHSAKPLQRRQQTDHSLRLGRHAQPPRTRARNLRLGSQQLRSYRRHHHQPHQQVQRQDRPQRRLRASRVLLLQPHHLR